MIKMPVRHQNGCGPRLFAESFGCRALNRARKSRQTGIDQNPFAVTCAGSAEENYVNDRQSLVSDVVRDRVGVVVLIVINFWNDRRDFPERVESVGSLFRQCLPLTQVTDVGNFTDLRRDRGSYFFPARV